MNKTSKSLKLFSEKPIIIEQGLRCGPQMGQTVLTSNLSFKLVETRLGTLIHGQLDQLERGVLFTDAFVARQMAYIRGVFSAITKYVCEIIDSKAAQCACISFLA